MWAVEVPRVAVSWVVPATRPATVKLAVWELAGMVTLTGAATMAGSALEMRTEVSVVAVLEMVTVTGGCGHVEGRRGSDERGDGEGRRGGGGGSGGGRRWRGDGKGDDAGGVGAVPEIAGEGVDDESTVSPRGDGEGGGGVVFSCRRLRDSSGVVGGDGIVDDSEEDAIAALRRFRLRSCLRWRLFLRLGDTHRLIARMVEGECGVARVGSVIGDGEIGVGALPARAAGGGAGGEVGGHLAWCRR